MYVLKVGSQGQEVKDLQKKLGLITDGMFGVKTKTAVVNFQLKNNLHPDGIVGVKTLEKLYAVYEPEKEISLSKLLSQVGKSRRNITRIVLHCTASWQTATIDGIKADWRARGWTNVGYAYIIMPNGEVVQLASEDVVTNGVKGYNSNSIHVCYIGGIEKVGGKIKSIDNRTDAQKVSLKTIVKELKFKYPKATILGHRDLAAKDCPCFNVKEWVKEIGL